MAAAPNRLTADALKYYVPIFQRGEAAARKLLEQEVTAAEAQLCEVQLQRREMAVDQLATLASPLITRELNKLIASSHLRTRDDIFTVLYYAGIDGLRRGLRKYDVDKLEQINSSSTNYLFQWITTYAKKELSVLEAPFGIPPTRFQRYKKVSAVRKKLSEQLGRYATNEEVYEYFQSGKADLKTMQGRVHKEEGLSQANQAIGLDLIAEQERFEKEMLNVELFDPQESLGDNLTPQRDEVFAQSFFGVFLDTHRFTPTARAVLMNDLQVTELPADLVTLLRELSEKEYRQVSTQWKNLIRDAKGPFHDFLMQHRDSPVEDFDVLGTLRLMEASDKTIKSSSYQSLFAEAEQQR